jgi:hypothetical protein
MKRGNVATPIHCVIFGLSTYLVGLYFGQALPAGIDMIALQGGLIGMLAFVGFSNRYNEASPQAQAQAEEVQNEIETRLERHVSNGQIRIDNGELTSGPVSSKQAKKQAGAYRYGIR